MVVETLKEALGHTPATTYYPSLIQATLLIIIKHQRPHLNTLPRRIILIRRIHKRRMRDPPRAPIINGIVTLDEQRLVGPLRVLEIPLVVGVGLDGVGLALAVGVDQLGGDEIGVGYGVSVGQGEGVSEDGFDGAPDIDDLEALLEELVRFVG